MDNSSSVFKTAIPQTVSETTAPQTPQPSIDPETGEPQDVALAEQYSPSNPSLEEYHSSQGQPYANEYFETGTPYEYLPQDMQGDLQSIEEFVALEIQNRHWKENLSNYHRVVEGIAASLDIHVDELSNAEAIERIATYAQSMLKLNGISDIQEQLRKQLRRARTKREAHDMVLKAIGKKIL